MGLHARTTEILSSSVTASGPADFHTTAGQCSRMKSLLSSRTVPSAHRKAAITLSATAARVNFGFGFQVGFLSPSSLIVADDTDGECELPKLAFRWN